MKHTIRVERHVLRDILASILGGALVVSVVQKSWIAGVLVIAAGAALFIQERADIEEEEEQ
jgi:uncharacterized membrane protein